MNPQALRGQIRGYHFLPGDNALSSYGRARIAAMNHDVITAGLWALAGFDPALVHFAELREHFRTFPEDHNSRISLDRALSIYLEGQCHELFRAAGITKSDFHILVDQVTPTLDEITEMSLACTDNPLSLEVLGYAMQLGVLTAHGRAPWKRYAAVVADCHAQLSVRA